MTDRDTWRYLRAVEAAYDRLYQRKHRTLANLEDLEYIHDIKVALIRGYDLLNVNQQNLFKEFILNLFNQCGVAARTDIMPLTVKFIAKDAEGMKNYIRFDYLYGDSKTWLHVFSPDFFY